MQSILVNDKITQNKILTIEQYNQLENIKQYVLYADNILEGITLLNDLTQEDDYLVFYGVLYQKIDQPIYIFKDLEQNFIAIKICGAYDKWQLPKDVAKIIHYIDLPDYVLYSVDSRKVVVAGENTETASVGNSQWQREGRKIGAAKIRVPFIYQTFYSGRDESQNTIREPSSLQAYNHFVYSVKYRAPSFVIYFDNNFENSNTRDRESAYGNKLLSNYIKLTILADYNNGYDGIKQEQEKAIYFHMVDYLREPKYRDLLKGKQNPRLQKDLPCINNLIYNAIITRNENFINEIVEYIYGNKAISEFGIIKELLNFNERKFTRWNSYSKKPHVGEVISYLSNRNRGPKTYITGNSKLGFCDTELVNQFLANKFPNETALINEILDKNKATNCILMPLRIHKFSNGKLTFSPDPESGEIVAYNELFAFNEINEKKKPVVGYCIVDVPEDFDISSKFGTKMYKALAEYVDILIINGSIFISNLRNTQTFEDYFPQNIARIAPNSLTEEMAVVATYLNQTTISSNWKLCFIHTHHSSWQEMMVYKTEGIKQRKIDRVSTKVDLILQKDDIFMISEGKNNFMDILRDEKIKTAMINASHLIDDLYQQSNVQFDAFIYNFPTIPSKSPTYYVSKEVEMIEYGMQQGHFNDVANNENYVVIIVYIDEENHTAFKLVYSPQFNAELKVILDREFHQ